MSNIIREVTVIKSQQSSLVAGFAYEIMRSAKFMETDPMVGQAVLSSERTKLW